MPSLPPAPAAYNQQNESVTRALIQQALEESTSNAVQTATQITANQNDYAIPAATTLRMSSDAARNVTGIVARKDTTLTLINVGAQNIVLQNENAGSTATNRIITGTGADITMAADDVATLWYDTVSGRWRVTNHY